MSIGESLKRARKRQNLELDDAARATKISKMFLIALEADDYSSLPGGVYTSNFLRAYSKFLGLDDAVIISEYHEQYQVKPTFLLHYEQTKKDDVQFKRERRKYFAIFGTIGAVLAVFAFLFVWPGFLLNLIDFTPKQPEAVKPLPTVVTAPKPASPFPEKKPDAGMAEQASRPPLAVEQGGGPASTSEPGAKISISAPALGADESNAKASVPPLTIDSVHDSHHVGSSALGFPIRELDGVKLVSGNAEQLTDVLGIKALSDVRVKIQINGILVTDRRLLKGQIRFYGLGRINSFHCDDGSKIAVQQGERVMNRLSEPGVPVSVAHFSPGQFFQVFSASGSQQTNGKQ